MTKARGEEETGPIKDLAKGKEIGKELARAGKGASGM